MEIKVNEITGFRSSVSGTGESGSLTAMVNVQNGTLSSVENGSVHDADGNQLANFSNYGQLSVVFMTSEETTMQSVLNDIITFINQCTNGASALNDVSEERAVAESEETESKSVAE